MSVITINLEQANALLDEVLAEHGEDFVYQGLCNYNVGEMPGCIVGQVLAKAGVPLDTLAKMDVISWREDGDPVTDTKFDSVARSHHFDDVFVVEPDVATLLNEAQTQQDQRLPWGHAVAAGRTRVEVLHQMRKSAEGRRLLFGEDAP